MLLRRSAHSAFGLAVILCVFPFCKSRNFANSSGRVSEYMVEEAGKKYFRIWLDEEGFVSIGACQNAADLVCKSDSARIPYEDISNEVKAQMSAYFESQLIRYKITITDHATGKTFEALQLDEEYHKLQADLETLNDDVEAIENQINKENQKWKWGRKKRIEQLNKKKSDIHIKITRKKEDLKEVGDRRRETRANGVTGPFKRSEFDKLNQVTGLVFERLISTEKRIFRRSQDLTPEALRQANFAELQGIMWQDMVITSAESAFEKVFEVTFGILYQRLDEDRKHTVRAERNKLAQEQLKSWKAANAASIRHRYVLSCKAEWQCPSYTSWADKKDKGAAHKTLSTLSTPWSAGPVPADEQDVATRSDEICRQAALAQMSDQEFAMQVYKKVSKYYGTDYEITWDMLLKTCPDGPILNEVVPKVITTEECLHRDAGSGSDLSPLIPCSEIGKYAAQPTAEE